MHGIQLQVVRQRSRGAVHHGGRTSPSRWQGRLRVVGGRTNVWGRQSYRLSQQDLKGKSFDGFGEDWPLEYKDLVPYYEIVEDYVGIQGMPENVPELPDSKFHPAMPLTCAETQLRTRVKAKFGRTITVGRSANITKPINGRQPCHYCGPCERGCMTHSYFNSAFTTVADALKSGNCTLITDAMVYKVLVDSDSGKATGVLYIDRVTREPRKIKARNVILCAQALESSRILLNSATRQYPNGLANSSGVLGHYLMDHLWVAGGASGQFPDVPAPKPSLNAPKRPSGLYTIRFRNTANGPRSKDFLRGFGFQGGGSSNFNFNVPGFGAAYKKAITEAGITSIGFAGFGEMLPRFENKVELDPDRHRGRVGHPRPQGDDRLEREREGDDSRHGEHGGRDAGGRWRQEHLPVPGARTVCQASASTNWAWRGWGTIPRHRSSTASASRTTSRTCS